MPKNTTRWSFNPKKWFGMTLKGRHKHNSSTRLPPPQTATTTTRTVPLTSNIPRIVSGKNRMKVIPISLSNDLQRENTSITQLQLPAFSIRRERTSLTFQRQKSFHPAHTEPTIRKNIRTEENLAIDTTRFNLPMITSSIYENFEQRPSHKPTDMSVSNISNRCLIDYPRHIVDQIEEDSLPSRSSSASSIMEDNDRSSSSGIFTDERQQTSSKDTSSTLEVLSIESIADSQRSFSHLQTRPIIHHYRRPMSFVETVEDKPQRLPSLIRSHRSQSVEGVFQDNSNQSPIQTRQPSVTRSRTTTATIKPDTLSYSRKNSVDSFAPFANYDDPLPSANDEECYATLPRTSSTEQLNHDQLQNDLRLMVKDCIRPIMNSIGKSRSMKSFSRFKRPNHPSQTSLNLENITDRLLSSMDYSIYTRYQRCN